MKLPPIRTYGTQQSSPNSYVIAMNAYVKNTERSQIIDLMLHLKLLENKNMQNPK
jgi:hypothetical protein